MKVSALTIYPVKSMAGTRVPSGALLNAGLQGDRRFMVVTAAGKFVTGRTHPLVTRIFPSFDGITLTLRHEGTGEVSFGVDALEGLYMASDVWGTPVRGQICPADVDDFISAILGEPVRLLYFGPRSQRQVRDTPGTDLGFADAYPLLILSEASLADLNSRLATPVQMANFRPNIVVSGTAPYGEDTWKRVRIGTTELALVSPCTRCIFTTVNPDTGSRDTGPDPLKTLAGYRKTAEGIIFGQNALPLSEGPIAVGDDVTVLETHDGPVFG